MGVDEGSLQVIDVEVIMENCPIVLLYGINSTYLPLALMVFVILTCFVRFHLCDFIKAAALRTIVLRYACAPTATRSYLLTVYVLF